MSQSESATCKRCGAHLRRAGAACPSCLLALGFEEDTTAIGGDPSPEADAREDAPAADDRFNIRRTLGEGGMGTVFLAEQTDPLQREVALKVIKRGMDTQEVIRRFDAERQALALMDHPSIARVYEAGETPAGQPFFSMEFVDGPRITDYADIEGLSTHDRVQLFARLCDGVQHAHQKGVIHRDLKPSNVLVARNGSPVPKIIDFGIAKATERSLTPDTWFTELGKVVGTPHYMSPEQAELSPLGVDTRSDIYSLGVLLYELLSGCRPFEIEQGGFDEMRRRIREEDPSTPSARLKTATDLTSEIARKRRVDVATLHRQLRGDLDWITMKALRKDPTKRYQSATELAEDLRRYLTDEPVSARPPSASYRVGKFVRRHRLGVAVGVAALVGLIGFAGTMTVQARLIAAERDRADQERERAQRTAGFLSGMLSDARPDTVGAALWRDLEQQIVTVRESQGADDEAVQQARRQLTRALQGVNPTDVARRLFDRDLLAGAAANLDESLGDDPVTAARVRWTLGSTYKRLGLYAQAIEQLAAAHEALNRSLGADSPETLRAGLALGSALSAAGQFDEALAPIERALEKFSAMSDAEDENTLQALHNMGVLLHAQGRLDEAIDHLQRAYDGRVSLLGEHDSATLASREALGMTLEDKGQLDTAEEHLRAVVDELRRTIGPNDPKTLATTVNLGVILDAAGKFDESESLYRNAIDGLREVYGGDHPKVLNALNNLGAMLRLQRRLDEAEPIYADVMERKRRVLGPLHPSTLTSQNNFGVLLRSRRRYPEAEQLFRQTYEQRMQVLGPDHRDTLGALNNLGGVLYRQRKLDQAEAVLGECIERYGLSLGLDHRDALGAIRRQGEVYEAQGKLEAALNRYLEALDGNERVLGIEHPITVNVVNSIAWLHRAIGEPARAEEYFRRVLELRRATQPEGHPWIAYAQVGLGRILIEQELFSEAETLLAEATAIRSEPDPRAPPWILAESQGLYGAALAGLGRDDEAEPLLRAAVAGELPTTGRLDRRQEAQGYLDALEAARE